MIQKLVFHQFTLQNQKVQDKIILSYQLFGQKLGKAPVVLVNHALTGNSQVIGESGWWNSLIGEGKTIDTDQYTILAFNVPGNTYQDQENSIENYKDFTVADIAAAFWKGVESLQIEKLYAAIGGSLGGAIAWQMAIQEPEKISHLIPVATDWKSTDWLMANVLVQDSILNNSKNPIADARMHAMLLYRTPQSLQFKFNREKQPDSDLFQIESWLLHHGDKLQKRFQLSAYKLMNHLLRTIDITNGNGNFEKTVEKVTSEIHIVAVDTDYFFTADENLKTYENLKKLRKKVNWHQIESIHGHDAFLIEFEQLNTILKDIFNK
ncbi:alpha/beta fold hydrolase [Flavobacterium sp. NRK F10]|uniref:alpha/beta fold hydrolase n=1 Tax=Flavobacterium sp. NRK F10 TaxID=2954931 RepID=UPI00209089D5|nr:alpha/beta fold hydrolase [Flavobacterium sp. NRK F10]MCO6174387.1 alpha/beta fold hydrolase [Flavobacterium sp. NRK F10]